MTENIKQRLEWCLQCGVTVPDLAQHLDEHPTHVVVAAIGTVDAAGQINLAPFTAQEFVSSDMPFGTHEHELSTDSGRGWRTYAGHVPFPQQLDAVPADIKFTNVKYVGQTASLRCVKRSLNKRGFRFRVRVCGGAGRAMYSRSVTGVRFDWEAIR